MIEDGFLQHGVLHALRDLVCRSHKGVMESHLLDEVQNKGVGSAIPRGRAKASCGDVLHDVTGADVCTSGLEAVLAVLIADLLSITFMSLD
jgi:hypothetical protein